MDLQNARKWDAVRTAQFLIHKRLSRWTVRSKSEEESEMINETATSDDTVVVHWWQFDERQ